jgi:hypothetical protein
MQKGDKIRVIRMDDNNGKDLAVHRMNGVVGVIDHIDSMGQIHLQGYGLAIIPEVDEFEIVEEKTIG